MKSKNVNIDVSESGNFFKPRRNNNKKILNLRIASICKSVSFFAYLDENLHSKVVFLTDKKTTQVTRVTWAVFHRSASDTLNFAAAPHHRLKLQVNPEPLHPSRLRHPVLLPPKLDNRYHWPGYSPLLHHCSVCWR